MSETNSQVTTDFGSFSRPGEINVEDPSDTCTGTAFEYGDTISQEQRFIDVVGDEHDGAFVLGPDALDLVLEFGSCQCVERRERLVHQQDLGLARQRPGNGDALPHAT